MEKKKKNIGFIYLFTLKATFLFFWFFYISVFSDFLNAILQTKILEQQQQHKKHQKNKQRKRIFFREMVFCFFRFVVLFYFISFCFVFCFVLFLISFLFRKKLKIPNVKKNKKTTEFSIPIRCCKNIE